LKQKMDKVKAMEEQQKQLQIKMGEAYNQLKACHLYAVKIQATLKTKYNAVPKTDNSKILWGVEEEIKQMGGLIFDGGDPSKPRLIDGNLGIGTHYFQSPRK
jgi:hypothetical protein